MTSLTSLVFRVISDVTIYLRHSARTEKLHCCYTKPLTIKELSLFSIILFYFRFGRHDNNENFINLLLMPRSKCLPSFKTLVTQIRKIAHVIDYFILESALITSSILLFYSFYTDICKISNFRNFSRKFYFELKYLENGLADFSDTYIIL